MFSKNRHIEFYRVGGTIWINNWNEHPNVKQITYEVPLMNILLTGSHGFIGKNVYELLKDKHWIQCLDTSIDKDIADCDLNYKDIDCVIHLAGSANVRDSLENLTKYWTNNVQNSKRLFDAFPNTRILYASSSTDYAEPWKNPYALSKKAMEMIAPPHALNMRFTTVYGTGGDQIC